MQAMVYTRYGAPADVLHVAEIDTPQPQADEVLIEIHASSVNYGDRALVRGKPFLVRFMGYGVRSPNYQIPG
ncbi:MAG: zinc-binding alcohol dehydrogenase family protein, partial [Caldilineaceae bacterium]|nr:zinc-binding alcohol dehydrogenase family protein [Caldilineaceae bacterium]